MGFRAAVRSRALGEGFGGLLLDGGAIPSPFRTRAFQWIQRRAASTPVMPVSPGMAGPSQWYEQMVKQGLLQQDPQQQMVAGMLDDLLGQLKDHQKQMEAYQVVLRKWSEEREKLKKVILREQAEFEAQRRLQRIADDQQKGIFGWWSRKVRNVRVEPGAGRMVSHLKREKRLDSLVGPRPPLPPPPQGLYLYGNVGCGKTMLMDMFFNASEGVVPYRRRMHFHAAMLEIHDRMHKLWKQRRQNTAALEGDVSNLKAPGRDEPMTLELAAKEWLEGEEHWERDQQSELAVLHAVADELLVHVEEKTGGASLLCFDEVQVMDVFTAVALAAILGRLLSRGTVIVATSNRAPSDLNKDGLQKKVFAAFITKLEQHCRAVLVGLDKDYRRALASLHHGKEEQVHYFWPLGSLSQEKLEQQWNELVSPAVSQQDAAPCFSTVPVMFGRILEIPHSYGGIARFSFQELCDRPLGAADYVSLAQNYHTVFVTNIPVMSMRIRDQARRFITLVDELYNHHCRLICTAAAPMDELFLGTDEGALIDLESLQFETEAEGSRLRRDVLVSGSVAPLAGTKEERFSIQTILSGREELFAFRRAVSRLTEMQSRIYLESLNLHPKFTNLGSQVRS